MTAPTILILTHDLGAGGVQRKIADVSAYLTSHTDALPAAVHVVLETGPPADPGERGSFEAVVASGVRVHCRPKAVPFPLFCLWSAVRLRPDRIVGFLRGAGVVAVALRYALPWRRVRIGVSDDSFPSGSVVEQTRGPVHAALIRRLVRAAYARADWVAAASGAARRDLVERFGVPERGIVVSRNWVRCRDASPNASAGSGDAMPSAPAADDGFDLIYVGRLAPVKNLSLFVEIVRAVRDVRPSVRAVIVGGGAELDALQRQASHLGLDRHLIFAGWQRDVRPWLAASRLFCLTSHHEGLPMAVLEAMASGVPVVSSRYPGADELVVDGVTGFLCRDRDEFADRIVQCLTQDARRREMGCRARALVATRYGPENLRQFAELIVRG